MSEQQRTWLVVGAALLALTFVWLLGMTGWVTADEGCGLLPRGAAARDAQRRAWFSPVRVKVAAISGCGYPTGSGAIDRSCVLTVGPVKSGRRDLEVRAATPLHLRLIPEPAAPYLGIAPPPVVPIDVELDDEGESDDGAEATLPVPAQGARVEVRCLGDTTCRLEILD